MRISNIRRVFALKMRIRNVFVSDRRPSPKSIYYPIEYNSNSNFIPRQRQTLSSQFYKIKKILFFNSIQKLQL